MSLKYPKTRTLSHIDHYFDIPVADPYRWLENDQSIETEQWVAEQNQLTESYLSQIPYRESLKEQLEELSNYDRALSAFERGGYIYYFHNNGLQNHMCGFDSFYS